MERITALVAARKSSGLSQDDCIKAMDISLPTFRKMEKDNDLMTIGQMKSLLPSMNSISVKIMHDYIMEIFLPYK